MEKTKKDFNAMLNNNKDMPKINEITDEKTIKKYGGTKMFLAPPIYYDKLIKKVPTGKLITTKQMRTYLAKKYNADFTDPMTAGIFVNIVAWASYQRENDITPYWRVLKTDGELNTKYPEAIELQKTLLEKEGHEIITKGTKNYLEGGKFKKVSLMPSDDLDSYTSYYSGDALTNYNKYTSYYGTYTKEELENILFATVKADNEDLQDGDPLYFYKGSGAISSDIDLYFEGEGFLSVTSKNKEGIETKGNLTFSGGIGDYEIYAKDDCLNTTTSNSVGNNVRNSLVIDVNSLVAVVDDEGDEGDAIDSNGTLTINGGNIYAFAHSNSGDAGLDSETGTFINGGTIIATGNMADKISNESKQKYIYVNFNKKQAKDTLIVIKDQNDKIITAFKTNKDITTLFYSSEDLDSKTFKIYSGGTIDGEETNGLYTKINSYENGEEITYTEVSSFNNLTTKNNSNNFILKLLIIEIISLLIIIIYILIDYYSAKRKQKLV